MHDDEETNDENALARGGMMGNPQASRTAAEDGGTQDAGQYTPGPWRVGLAPGVPDELEILSPQRFFQVASVWGGLDVNDDTNPTMHANARLIAAAPELLDALRRLVVHDEAADWREGLPNCAELDRARDAIAKAIGAPPSADAVREDAESPVLTLRDKASSSSSSSSST
jgi:hypothetical protein